ncbi:MAG: carbohydrate ABC transporter permease [Anaerolineales bacterium]|jgi:multiple sugar transport system permease protein
MNIFQVRRTLTGVGLNMAALIVIFIIVAPFLWVIIASLQGENELLRKPPSFLPQQPTLDNYNYVFTGTIPTSYEVKGQLRSRISQEARMIAPALKNSFIVASAVTLIDLFLGVLAAYSFARLRLRGKAVFYNFILASRLIPAMAIAIPYYVIIQSLKLLDTYWSLILVYTVLTLPFAIWFLTLYLSNIPRDIEEAALMDGCNRLGALTRVVAPMALPGLVAAAAFAFMSSYNEFLFARFLTQSIKSQTVPVIIASVAGNPDASYTLISVCMTLAIIPPLILAVVMRRWLTQGLSASVTYR